jgi:hypothetical protein
MRLDDLKKIYSIYLRTLIKLSDQGKSWCCKKFVTNFANLVDNRAIKICHQVGKLGTCRMAGLSCEKNDACCGDMCIV